MYQEFFGFTARPFQLLPNPDYLFLSASHEEALGHLLYAVSHGEGFVEITGEVGTGKTTLCRALLESLGDEVQAAYVFHPKLDPLELLQAVAAEFGIPSRADTAREMIDILHRFLIAKKEERKRVLLIIDEAQNLTADVLEQIRLLSNLETTTSKLIQIMLVGQPELSDLLASHELRQLRQRISLRCRLKPLTAAETRRYIRHRVRQAGRKEKGDLFTRGAVTRIHRYSGGVPRLVNIACDRALLLAYGTDKPAITTRVARKAIRELEEGAPSRPRAFSRARVAVVLLLAVAILVATESVVTRDNRDPPSGPARPAAGHLPGGPVSPAFVEADSGAPATPAQAPPADALQHGSAVAAGDHSLDDLIEFLGSPVPYGNRDHALVAAMDRWRPETAPQTRFAFLNDDLTFFRLNAQSAGLSVTPVSGGVAMLASLNVPAIMELYGPRDHGPKYMALTRISGDGYRLEGMPSAAYVEVQAGDLYRVWTGRAFVVWRNFLGLDGVIPLNSSQEAIVSLKLLLTDMGVKGLDTSPEYDEVTRRAVIDVQRRHGLFVDGLVGPLTAIALYNVAGIFRVPHLGKTGGEQAVSPGSPGGPSPGGTP